MSRRIQFVALLCGVLSLATVSNALESKPSDTRQAATNQLGPQSDSAQPTSVVPIPNNLIRPKPASGKSKELLQAYYESLEDWGQVVRKRLLPVPDKPNWRYIGLPRNIENHLRPTAYSAMVLSFLSECQPPKPLLDEAERTAMRGEAIGLLRYLTTSHVSGGGACLNGKPWGNQWQSAPWSRSVGMAAWQIWPHLEKDLQQAVIRMIEFEADRFITKPPKSSVVNDTGAEENAWNASIDALACNMMPEHPRAAAWELAAKNYMYNTFSVKADSKDKTLGDDGKPINQWVTTVNAHDDFTVENHRLVHVGYLKNSAAELEENAVHWLLSGKTPPRACQHHMPEVFQVLSSCMNWNAAPIYFGGNDWRIYESQCTDVVIYCMLNLITNDPQAAYLEKVAVEQLRKRQIAEGGYYNARRDLEYGGLCATRIIACFYAHAAIQSPEIALSSDEFNLRASGVSHLESARTVLHRTPTKFASFTWAQKRMALAIPSEDGSVVWPHFASYLGMLNGRDSSARYAKLLYLQIETDEHGFQVTGTLSRCKGQLEHDFYYASAADDYTVYVERLRPKTGFQLKSRESGVIGLEYSIDSNQRILYGSFGSLTAQGKGGPKSVRTLTSNWLNIDNKIGFVVCRPVGQQNIMRYHDNNKIAGRKPHLQEWISLVGEETPDLTSDTSWTCVVTFLNQDAQQTKSQQALVKLTADRDHASCLIGEKIFHVDFSRQKPGGKQ